MYNFIMNKIIGEKLKELRVENQLTQNKLAQIFHVSKTTICQWETGKQEPSIDSIIAIALYFDVSSDYLLGLEDESGARTATQINNLSYFNNSGTIKF